MGINETQKKIKIGTRGSPLALCQANMVEQQLLSQHPDLSVEIIAIKSAADWQKSDGEKSLSAQDGGKGLFAKEIEQAILDGQVDCGVHSAKDMASFLPEELEISHFLPRHDARDVLISNTAKTIEDLPKGAIVGTCSPRRQSIALACRPDLKIVPFRGNVQTRIDKIKSGQVDATFLALAGLERLGIEDSRIHPIDIETMLPAAGQGAICIETRQDDIKTQELFEAINCMHTQKSVLAEREVLKILDGSCHTPIGVYAQLDGDIIFIRTFIGAVDGAQIFKKQYQANILDNKAAIEFGQKIGHEIKKLIPSSLL